ncbi:MAG TPA: 50S ribosomal protein L21 [Candidatus Limicola stercorigallinarum]|nr:50S ribosomal protein L21 [Candidatus Limicola stercorigallinarum]
MYAIVSTGGKQYKVAADDVINVEKIEGEIGDKVELPVIFLNDGKKIITDAAKLAKAKVTAEIVDQFKGEKQLVFKFKKRKRYRRLKGHRQQLTRLKITKVQATSRAAKKTATDAEAAAPAATE